MKIISIKWRHGSSDFVHITCNDDVAQSQLNQLRKADTQDLFDIAVFMVDSFGDALQYIKDETTLAKKDAKGALHSYSEPLWASQMGAVEPFRLHRVIEYRWACVSCDEGYPKGSL